MVAKGEEENRFMMFNIFQRFLNKLAFVLPGGFSVRPFLQKIRGVKIGKDVWISQYVYMDELHPEAITIEDNCTIGLRTTIFTHFYWGKRRATTNRGEVYIGKDVYIGPHCVILPNVRIGDGAVVKAGTVVTRNVPPRTLFGIPSAEVLGRVTVPLTRQHSYEEFKSGLRPIRRNGKKERPESRG